MRAIRSARLRGCDALVYGKFVLFRLSFPAENELEAGQPVRRRENYFHVTHSALPTDEKRWHPVPSVLRFSNVLLVDRPSGEA